MEDGLFRESGLKLIGKAPWGTHFCQFYQTKQDLIDILVPYFKAGLKNNEFCMWITSEPLGADEAKKALAKEVKNLDDYIKKGQIEILDYRQWYVKSGGFNAEAVLAGWATKEKNALKNGFAGLRLTGNTFWLEKKDWKAFTDYEEAVNNVIGQRRMMAVCTYSLDKCNALEIIDVKDPKVQSGGKDLAKVHFLSQEVGKLYLQPSFMRYAPQVKFCGSIYRHSRTYR